MITTSRATNEHDLFCVVHAFVLDEVLDDSLEVAVASEVQELVLNGDGVGAVASEARAVAVSEHDVVPVIEVGVSLTALLKINGNK